MEIWDGYYPDGSLAGIDLIRTKPIPSGLYHLVAEVLVQHTDGDFLLMRRAASKASFPGFYEATAGGSALKGEDALTCVTRELAEETGIRIEARHAEKIAHTLSHNTIYESFFCRTNWEKDAITLQAGETDEYLWINEAAFIDFICSGQMIPTQRERYKDFFARKGYLPHSL